VIGGIDFTNENSEMKVGNRQVLEVAKGSTILGTFHSWRLPIFSDILSGQTVKITVPSSPIVITDWSRTFYNNNYLISSGNYTFRELNNYEEESQASDYSWMIMRFIAGLYFYDNAGNETVLYKCVNRVKIVYDSQGNPTYTLLSTDEQVKRETFTLPNDFGYVLSYGGSNQGLEINVDDYRVSKQPYTLAPLLKTDNLQNRIVIVCDFPESIINILYPNGANENVSYTLFEVQQEIPVPGEEYPSYYAETFHAVCEGDYVGQDSQYNPIYDGYFFVIQDSTTNVSTFVCRKKFGETTPIIWNKVIIIGGAGASIPLTNMDTSSPLYPYVKKVVWGN
jgi:hypothetical protein